MKSMGPGSIGALMPGAALSHPPTIGANSPIRDVRAAAHGAYPVPSLSGLSGRISEDVIEAQRRRMKYYQRMKGAPAQGFFSRYPRSSSVPSLEPLSGGCSGCMGTTENGGMGSFLGLMLVPAAIVAGLWYFTR